MDKRHLLRSARHESGHVVLALFFGGTFENVEIALDDNPLPISGTAADTCTLSQEVGGAVRELYVDDDHANIITLMGGAAGTKVNRKKPGAFTFFDMLTGCEGDYRAAKAEVTPRHIQCFARKAKTLDGYLNECHVLAHQIIVKYKDVHTALVDALMKKGSLTYNECKRVWNERD
jgi:hypothetical protein